MRQMCKQWTALLILATLVTLPGCLRSSQTPAVVLIPEDKTVVKLPDGNYRVTPSWLQERYQNERYLKEQLKKCRGE